MQHTCMFTLIFACYSRVACMSFHMQSKWHTMHKNNVCKFNKCEPHHKHKQEPQNIAQYKPYLKVVYNAFMLLLMDLMILYSTIIGRGKILAKSLPWKNGGEIFGESSSK